MWPCLPSVSVAHTGPWQVTADHKSVLDFISSSWLHASPAATLPTATKWRKSNKKLTLDLGRGVETWETSSDRQHRDSLLRSGNDANRFYSFFLRFTECLILLLHFPLHVNEGVMPLCNQRGRKRSGKSVCWRVIDAGLITTKKRNSQAVEFKQDWFCSLNLLAWGKKKWLYDCVCVSCDAQHEKKEFTKRQRRRTYKAPEEMQHSVFVGAASGGGLLGWSGQVTPERPLRTQNTPVTPVSTVPASSAAPFVPSVSLLIDSARASSF